jgi:hypothetical protein
MTETTIFYTESEEIQKIAENLKARYYNIIGYIDLEKIFFAFKGGDENFKYEIVGTQNDWLKFAIGNPNQTKLYCISLSYDFYQFAEGALLEWTILELLYSCAEQMNGKLRKKNVHEYSRFLKTLQELDISIDWRKNVHLPKLLGDETIMFELEDELL